MRTILLICLMSVAATSFGQGIIPYHASDAATPTAPPSIAIIAGVPYSLDKYVRIVNGSPFFNDTWMKGKVLLLNGSISAALLMRLNLLDNEVNFIDSKGKEMTISAPMRYIMMTDSAGNEYSFLHGDQLTEEKDLQDVWFQVLVNSRISLCKQIKMAIRESKPYGSATAEQSIQTSQIFFVHRKNELIRIKKWDDLLSVLDDKKQLVRQYCKEHHLSGRSDNDYIQLLTYYDNSL